MRIASKRLIRPVSVIVSAAVAFSLLGAPVSGLSGENGAVRKFSTSFESGETLMLESVQDGNRCKNVGYVADKGRMKGDVTHLIGSDTLDGSPDFNSTETMQNLFDYNTSSKFLTKVRPSAAAPAEVIVKLEQPAAVVTYLIASANDESGRDPSSWKIYGSQDGAAWVELDSQSSVVFAARLEEKKFSFENTTAYTYYKISITENRGADMTQFSEFQLADELQTESESDLTSKIDIASLTGSPDFVAGESKAMLFDRNTYTKFLTNSKPDENNPVIIAFKTTVPVTVNTYIIGAGPDELTRNPNTWRLEASADDGENWIVLDERSGIVFQREQEVREFTVDSPAEYSIYRLVITQNNGAPMTQFSELQLFNSGGGTVETQPEGKSPMKTRKSRGPSSSFNTLTNTGWTGWSALEVLGRHIGSGEAYCSNIVHDGLSIPVNKNTRLSYVFFPALYNPDEYDYNYTSQFMSVNLKFSDGTYLSDLSATDQNGGIVSPEGQGSAGTLAYMQWNYIDACIGEVANGKTIEQILISYSKPENKSGRDIEFMGYFDDIIIEDKEPVNYEHLSDYVNILRGTNNDLTYSRGIVTPLVTLPHGFNAYAPITESNSTLPYYYQLAGNRTTLRHISIEHVASPWLGDWGTWQFMPNTSISYDSVTDGSQINADSRAANFKHANEVAKAHYYSVAFDDGSAASGVKMEITPTNHGMYARFSFPEESENRNLIFDCERADGGLTFNSDGSFTAYSDHVSGFGTNNPNQVNGGTRMYIYGVIEGDYTDAGVFNKKQGIISFGENTGIVTMKLATSFISEEQARKNLSLEIKEHDDFDSIYRQAQKTWDEQLGIIEVEGATPEQLTTLYSCMYRMFAYPTLYSENAGTEASPRWVYSSPYSGSPTDPDIKSGKMYTTNGFWDTYRSAWPAYSLLTPSMAGEMIDGLVLHYTDSGWVSRWLAPGAINCMLGTGVDSIFGDAMAKGISFDYENAFKASLKNSAVVSENFNKGGRIETETAIFRGYTSTSVHEGLSWGLEDSINDFNIFKMAEILGKNDEAEYYKNRALSYKNYFNSEIGWYMARNADGSFRYASAGDFNPGLWHEKSNWDYCEANAWNMIFTAVQDVQGMANLYGGTEKAIERLDELFTGDLSGEDVGMRERREVRLGQYNHTNEPSLHLAYMYDYFGQPWKTQEIVRDVMARCYTGSAIGQGYLGDEDNGAMSAWYVLSALGIYPASVGNPEYSIGSPLFKKATVHLENGEDLVINAPNNSAENVYIQSVKINREAYDKAYINHDILAKGCTIDLVMGNEPSSWGTGENAQPTSLTKGDAEPNLKGDIIADNTLVSGNINTTLNIPVMSGSSTTGLSQIFDDTSATVTQLTGQNKQITYYSPIPQKISVYTLTSADKNSAPSSFSLYGSSDGKDWVELDSRNNVSFEWNKYTKPFAVDSEKQSGYNYYRLAFGGEGNISLAEIELIGQEYIRPESISLDKSEVSLTVGDSTRLNATLLPANAVTEIIWRSSDKTVAAVNESGLVTAVSAGEAVITAVCSENESLSASCTITVTGSSPQVLKGDMDGNGDINVSDVVALRQAIMNNSADEYQKIAGDMDDSGQLNVSDVVALRMLIMNGGV